MKKHVREAWEAANAAIFPLGAKLTDDPISQSNHIKYGVIRIADGKELGHIVISGSPRTNCETNFARQRALRVMRYAASGHNH